MTKCQYCGREVIDSVMSDVCQSCALEENYYGGGAVYVFDPQAEAAEREADLTTDGPEEEDF